MKKIFLALLLFVFLISSTGCDLFSLEKRKYKQAINLAGEWFLNNQNNRFLHYTYYPDKNEYDAGSHALREMGALWAISKLYHFTKDDRYKVLSEKGLVYFENYLKYDQANDFYYLDISSGKSKLGYSAFMVLALLESDDLQKDYYLEKLANGIMYLQDKKSGEFKTFFFSDQNTGQDYYPGEALLAMMSLYEYDQQEEYLLTVKRALPHYVKYWRDNKNTAFVPWHTQAYTKLYNLEAKPELADFIFEMSDYMLSEYGGEDKCQDFKFNRGIVTAVHLEGVVQAYQVAEKRNDKSRIKCYKNFIDEGLDFIVSLQERLPSEFEYSAIGGFWGSKQSNSMRVDRNQHAVMALMGAYQNVCY